MIRPIAFHPDHLKYLDPSEEVENFEWYNTLTHNFEKGDLMISFFDGGRLACINGFQEIFKGVGELWQFNSTDIQSCGLGLAKGLYRTLGDVVVPHMGLHRVQITVEDKPHLHRWAKFLKFKQEGRLESFFKKGEDVFLYARIF